MNNKIKVALRVLGYILVIHVLVSFFLVYRMINPERITTSRTPEFFGLEYEDIEFESDDGTRLSGWYLDNEKDETVVVMHGYPADKGDMLSVITLLADDFNVLAFDFRGLGESDGQTTLGSKETKDLDGAIDYLQDERGVEEVSLWGFSMGAGVALQVAPQRDEVIAVVSDSSFSSMEKSLSELFPVPGLSKTMKPFISFWSRVLADVDPGEVSPHESVKEIEIPVYIIHALEDPVIDVSHAKKIEEALGQNAVRVEYIDSESHGKLPGSIDRRLKDFLQKTNSSDR